MSDKKQSTEGLPMFIESLMTPQEWTKRMKEFPTTSRLSYNISHMPKSNPFKWRHNMGKSLSQEQIDNINNNLDYLMKKANVKS